MSSLPVDRNLPSASAAFGIAETDRDRAMDHDTDHDTDHSEDRAEGCGADLGVAVFTPAQAAAVLQVRESWLRRRAAERRVPCTMLGKHLRFSRADLDMIVADSARPSRTPRRAPRVGGGSVAAGGVLGSSVRR
ncbi:helix-turn-helix domain-containing protein [Actinophytocola gossypii]|uniref:helix-turn-helix domain-containing protein n=1 Tax=Actinophytocola gossypii TaxID=2812003 RepID=UPI0035CD2CD7